MCQLDCARATSRRHESERGLTLKHRRREFHGAAPASPTIRWKLGPQDYVILTLKAHGLCGHRRQHPAAASVPDTAFVFAQNGLPWWYFYRHGGPYDGCRLESVDPGGRIWERFGPERCIGSVVWQAAEMTARASSFTNMGTGCRSANLDGSQSPRAKALSAVLMAAGIKSPVRTNLRDEIWLKLWGNLSFNPVSVSHTANSGSHGRGSRYIEVIRAMMDGVPRHCRKPRHHLRGFGRGAYRDGGKVGAHRTSMLQDVEAGRPTELDALLGSVVELSDMTCLPAPVCRMIYNLTRARIAADH